MGIVLSAVVGAVGAVELVSVLHYISDEWLLHQLRTENRDTLENALSKYQDEIRNSIAELGRRDSESVNYMQDGVAYENGFRQNDEPVNEELRLKFERRLKEILQESNIGAATADEIEMTQNGIELAQGLLNTEENENFEFKSEIDSKMTHEKIDDNFANEIKCEPVECVSPRQVQSEMMSESIENQFEIVTHEECETYENIKSLSITQESSEIVTTRDDLEPNTENVHEILNKEISEENDETDSSTFPSIHFNEYDRFSQVDDEYLHTLDGMKKRPLVRDDGTGRRRAFKKRNSSSSLSQELKSSREEELKMFTSLEEAELASMKNDFVPIKYSSEPNLASTSSSSSSSNSPNGNIKAHRHRHSKHRNISDENITEIDEENDEIQKVFSVDEIHSDDVTHPWGDIKPDTRRGSDYFNLQKQISIDEVPELNLDNPGNVAISDEFEEAETKSQYQEAINVLKKQDSKDEVIVNNHQDSATNERISTDRHVSMDDNNFPSASFNVNTPAVIAITNATTINITNNNIQAVPASIASTVESVKQTDKIDELTNRLQRIEQAIEQKISDWSNLPHRIDDTIAETDNSDEEPDYSQRKKQIHQKLDYDQVEVDFQKVLEDNEIDFNEDSSYLPKLNNTRQFLVLDSDEEPHHVQFNRCRSNNAESDASNSEIDDNSGVCRGRRLQKHKRHDNRVYYESDEEPYYGSHNRPIKQKRHANSTQDNYNLEDGVFTSTIVIGNEKEFVLDSDDEPISKTANENTGAISKFYKSGKEQIIATVIIPQLGLVRSYTYDSDEEPYYLEKRISFDDQSRKSAISKANRDDNIVKDDEYKKRLYDEYEIEENDDNINYDPKINSDQVYSWESDEEPHYDENQLIKEHQRRSKSPSRSPPIRLNNENMLGMAMTQNFLDLEREIEEEDRSTCSNIHDKDNIIHLGLLGNTRIKTSKRVEEQTETITETSVEKITRRKYNWEEKVASTITSYHRGELKTTPPNEDDDGNDEHHMWASDNEDTQKSVIERELDNAQSDHDSIDEIQDEEVPNGAEIPEEKVLDISENVIEGAVGVLDNLKENSYLRSSPRVHDSENIIEPSNETFDSILNNIEHSTKKINDEMNYILNEKAIMVESENVDRESSLTSSGEELLKFEATKIKEKKLRGKKKKKKSIGEKIDEFIKIERDDQNDSSSTTKLCENISDDTIEFTGTETGHRNRQDSLKSISKFDRSQVYDEFLLHEKSENNEQTKSVVSPTRGTTSKQDLADTSPNISEENESSAISKQQPNTTSSESPESNQKRRSISRPDPLYLLKESMYPFY